MERWEGRVALVTGASSGIGAAIAEQLVKQGMIVVGFARRAERIEALSKELSGQKGKLYAFKGDLQNEEDIKAAFTWVEDHFKSPVHVLVNNAAFSSLQTLLGDTAENWKQTMEINVIGLSVCTREAVKSMRAHGFDEGHIININSLTGHGLVSYAFPMYQASKFALTAITEALRKQLMANKSKIRVTSLSPGVVKTEKTMDIPAIPSTEISMLLPSDIADAVTFVLSLRQQVHIAELKICPAKDADFTPIEKMLDKLE